MLSPTRGCESLIASEEEVECCHTKTETDEKDVTVTQIVRKGLG